MLRRSNEELELSPNCKFGRFFLPIFYNPVCIFIEYLNYILHN